MDLSKLREEYATQDNRGTASPLYVQVQELRCVGVMASGYSASCPFGDDETKTEYMINCDSEPDSFESHEDAVDSLKEQYEGDEENLQEAIDDIQELTVGYVWHPVEFFLTIKGAEEYMNANKHNHGKLRTYVCCFERRNYEMRELLSQIRFKSKD